MYYIVVVDLLYTTVRYYYYFIVVVVVVVSCLCTRVSPEWGRKRTCSPAPAARPHGDASLAGRPAHASDGAVRRVRAFSSLAKGSKNSGPHTKRLQTLRLVFGGVYVCCTPLQQYVLMSIITTSVYNIIRLL